MRPTLFKYIKNLVVRSPSQSESTLLSICTGHRADGSYVSLTSINKKRKYNIKTGYSNRMKYQKTEGHYVHRMNSIYTNRRVQYGQNSAMYCLSRLSYMSWSEGRGAPMIFSAALTVCCRVFRQVVVQCPYHTVMELVRML